MNQGKRFEQDFMKSIPDYCFKYKFRDNPRGGEKSDKFRFTASNICDILLFDDRILYLLELKSVKGISLPFGNINKKSLREMDCKADMPRARAYLVVEYRQEKKVYAIEVWRVLKYMEKSDRKSIPITFAESYGEEIQSHLKRTRFSYGIEEFLEENSKGVF